MGVSNDDEQRNYFMVGGFAKNLSHNEMIKIQAWLKSYVCVCFCTEGMVRYFNDMNRCEIMNRCALKKKCHGQLHFQETLHQ